MKPLYFLLFLVLFSCQDPFENRFLIKPKAARVKAVVDEMAGEYMIVKLEENGINKMDSLQKYIQADGTYGFSFSNYESNLWIDHGNPNYIPQLYKCSSNSKEIKFQDSLQLEFPFGSYEFKNFRNQDNFDSLIIRYKFRLSYLTTNKIYDEDYEVKSLSVLKILNSCKRTYRNDSLILENVKLKSILIFKKINKQ